MKSISRIGNVLLVTLITLFVSLQVNASARADAPDQTITVDLHAPASAMYGASFTVAASSDSGLAVSYSAVGACTNLGATFTMTAGSGSCTVQYDQAGDGSYNAAPQVTELVTAQPAAITVTADTKTKTYGDADPALSYTITSGALVGADDFSGALARDPGEDAGDYAIMQDTLALSADYDLTYAGANLSIGPAPITVSADAKTKLLGQADPALTYTITSGALVGTDDFTGSLARDPGELIGSYAVTQGTLALSANYTLSYVSANLVITPATVTISGNAGIAGAILSYTDGTPKTATANGSGLYSFTVTYHWSGPVVPSKTGYRFSPIQKYYPPLVVNQSAQNYTAFLSIATLQAPLGRTTVPFPTYKWSKVAGATQYQYELWNGSALVYMKTVASVGNCVGTACSHKPGKVLADGQYKWRIRAVVGARWMPFSGFKQFKLLTVPVAQYPAGIIFSKMPTYQWTKVTGATQYQIELWQGSTLSFGYLAPASACGVSTCSARPAITLSYPGNSTWKVRAMVSGVWRPLSAGKIFRLTWGIPNGNFELGPNYWAQSSTHGWDIIVPSFPGGIRGHSGSWAAWLGGDNNDLSYVQQTIAVPVDAPYLVFWQWAASAESMCGYDYGSVLVNGNVVEAFNLCAATNTGGWRMHSVSLIPYRGQNVTLQIRVQTDGSINSNLFVDDVFVAATPSGLLPAEQFVPSFDPSTFQSRPGTQP